MGVRQAAFKGLLQKFYRLMNTQSGIRAESGGGNLNPGTDTVAVEKAGNRKLSGGFPGSGPGLLAGLWEFKIGEPGRVYIPGK